MKEAFEIGERKNFDLLNFLGGKLRQESFEKINVLPSLKPFDVVRKDDEGRVIAGASVGTYWNWLYVDKVWVDKAHRGKKIGTELIAAIESHAKAIGAIGFYLYTGDFEAPGFYEKLGFKEFVRFADCPTGYQRIGFLKKVSS